eukprot:s1083_g10.t1
MAHGKTVPLPQRPKNQYVIGETATATSLLLHSGTAEAFHDLLGPEEQTATSSSIDTSEHDFRNELRDAVRACDVERLVSVLDSSGSSLPSPRRVEILCESDGSGRTLLHLCPTWANSSNATKAVRKLLHCSANCEAVDAFGRTPLEAAIESCAHREMEDPEPVLKLCEALIPRTQVFLDKQTGDTAIGRAIVTLLQDHGVAVEVEGEPAPATEAVEESTVAAGPETSKRARSRARAVWKCATALWHSTAVAAWVYGAPDRVVPAPLRIGAILRTGPGDPRGASAPGEGAGGKTGAMAEPELERILSELSERRWANPERLDEDADAGAMTSDTLQLCGRLAKALRQCATAKEASEPSDTADSPRQEASMTTGNFIQNDGKGQDSKSLRRSSSKWLHKVMKSYYVANFMALVVLMDAYCTCAGIDARAANHEPDVTLLVISDVCLVLYTLELTLIFYVFDKWSVVKDWMMILDVIIVGCGWLEIVMNAANVTEFGFRGSIKVTRVLRLVRIFRLIRLLRRVRTLKELHKLATMMATCMRTLLWCFLLCFVVMTGWAMLLVEVVYPIMQEMIARDSTVFSSCEFCSGATSSVMSANLLLFKTVIAGDSWGELAVPIITEHPATAIIFVGSQLTIVFGVVNLIVAVVARENDVQNLAEEMEAEIQQDSKTLAKVFERIDKDGSGKLTLEDLIEGARTDTAFQSRLRVMDIDETLGGQEGWICVGTSLGSKIML